MCFLTSSEINANFDTHHTISWLGRIFLNFTSAFLVFGPYSLQLATNVRFPLFSDSKIFYGCAT